MKRHLFVSLFLLAMGFPVMAQGEAAPIPPAALTTSQTPAAENPFPPPPAFLDVVQSNGTINFLIWLGISFWALAVVPVGILSIVRSKKSKTGRLQMASKLLAIGAICVVMLGLLGFSRGLTATFINCALAKSLSSAWCEISLSFCHALYSLSVALLVCHLHFLFLLPTIIILHVRRKRLEPMEPKADVL